MAKPVQSGEPTKKRKASIDPMMLPPQKHIEPSREPEQGPRWLHLVAGLMVGFVVGGACSKFLWRRLGIDRVNTMAFSSLAFAVAGAVLRGKLWRWLRL